MKRTVFKQLGVYRSPGGYRLITYLCSRCVHHVTFPEQQGFNYALLGAVDAFPAADVAPVVHGRWVNGNSYTKPANCNDSAECSVCGEESEKWGHGYSSLTKYCPNCGAKMDLEGDNDCL